MADLTPPNVMAPKLAGAFGHLTPVRPRQGWLRAARDAQGISQRAAAAKAGVSQQAFAQFETGELRETITIERLRSAASALGCELVYFIRPKARSSRAAGRGRTTAGAKAASEVVQAPTRTWTAEPDLPVNLL